MILLRKDTLLKAMNPPSPKELADWAKTQGHYFPEEFAQVSTNDYMLYVALWYANQKYPEASELDKASFATVVAGFSTGLWGGFGTDYYEKEMEAQARVLEHFGGYLNKETGHGIIPHEVLEGEPTEEQTLEALKILEELYFG